MEFAAVNSPKTSAKTVAITLTSDEAKNPANAFAALLNLGNVSFNAEQGLTQAEGQWLRAQAQRDRDTAPKPKAEHDDKPKDKVSAAEKPANDDHDDDVAATETKSTKADDASGTEKTATTATTEAQPTDQTAAVGLNGLEGVAIQFQILVQLPNGNVQDMGTFDLKALLAAASQDSSLASALEAAFGQAAKTLASGQSLLSSIAQNVATGPDLAINPLQADANAVLGTADTTNVADLFKKIAEAFKPLAQEAAANATATQTAQNTQTNAAATATAANANLQMQSPEAAEQAAELSRILGEDNKLRIQVTVNGRTVADLPFEWSPYNRFSGYNPAASRTASTANGQAGQGVASNAIATPDGAQLQATPTPAPTANTNTSAQANAAANQAATPNGLPRAEVAAVRAPDAPTTQAASTSSNSAAAQQQPTSFASALGQTVTSGPTAQASAPERPAPAQSQQVVEQIKVNITRAAKAGLDRVIIKLRPEELGRIEIKLEMTSTGDVRANITADNPATLELLQREARGLERALQDAGLRASADDLEFNLHSEDQARLTENSDEKGSRGGRDASKGPQFGDPEAEADDMYDYAQAATLRGGVDTYV